MDHPRWVPSRFNVMAETDDGGLILYNSYTGAIAEFASFERAALLQALGKEGITGTKSPFHHELFDMGFLVADQEDEKEKAHALHRSLQEKNSLHLIIFPNEACNFRCTYCYENFTRGAMPVSVREGLKRLVERAASEYRHITVSWFGGEPLLSPEIMGELSEAFLSAARKAGIGYTSDITTNGYLLTEPLFHKLLSWGVSSYMITIDGTEDCHDRRRPLRTGGKTFQTIIGNLLRIQQTESDFQIHLRVNFDEDNLANVPELISFLASHFAGDPRFQLYVRPVGRWGGPYDDSLPVCDAATVDQKIWEFTEMGLRQGLTMSSMIENTLLPGGAVCYAAKPHSLVIGSDGSLYKCTVALNDPVNQVGRLHEDGSLDLDEEKIAMWTLSGEERDEVCRSCFFRPACQGCHCPLYRMRTGLRPCSHEKRQVQKVLRLIWKQANI